ncbi:hypothetical protein VINI7043_22507 [Vibrio nigripulchritudo ATCC 27043]|uniref:endonuclease/exonuclease/phosphatase family protein n=1 Tax=Vibrio nigripulchritudo TaxID=28173 RepID=UPI00021C317D|nr:endonuclease/exonuclease/phosphatase family protein [Vibrio nigripulchritudo]EGU56988.1 hypothetical protein VINI7043_22507 [Vibrio nigripulchritudo ATCC 27043]
MKRFLLFLLTAIHYPALATELTLSTWNIEWLTTNPSKRIEPSLRKDRDFVALRDVFSRISEQPMHIFSFQEVDSEEALMRVTGTGYQYYFSDRARKKHQDLQFEDINQYTGFAVSEGIEVSDPDDLNLLPGQFNKLRFATYIVAKPKAEKPIHLLSIHLKSGCFAAKRKTDACRVLAKQGNSINAWITERLTNNQSFVIIGDFNHNLAYPNDWLWKILSKGTKGQVVLNSKNTSAECRVRSRTNPTKTHQYRNLIDHVVSSSDLNLSQSKQITFSKKEALSYRLSDHCPLTSTLSF